MKNSTYAEWFYEKFPERFLECKIAEQNMYSVAAGLSAAGKIPFTSTFAKFVMRGYDQIEMAIISGANIKLTGSHAGVTLACILAVSAATPFLGEPYWQRWFDMPRVLFTAQVPLTAGQFQTVFVAGSMPARFAASTICASKAIGQNSFRKSAGKSRPPRAM